MRTMAIGLVLVVVLGMVTSQAAAEAPQPAAAKPAEAKVSPPARPLPITVEQADALEEIAESPPHAVPEDTRAAYSPEADRFTTELSVRAVQIGIPGTILGILIAAAPL